MSIGDHIAEIARQGIWASLTGGWYYEPSNTIFCNTLHLYIWLALLTLPLVLGIFASGTFNIVLLASYLGFIVALFSILKLIVSYLHNVFDTTEPIIKYKTKKSVEPCRSLPSSFSARATNTNEIEMVELGDPTNKSIEEEEEASERSKHTKVEEVTDESEEDLVQALYNSLTKRLPSQPDEESSSGSSKNSAHGLLSRKEPEGVMLPADSLELLDLPGPSSRDLKRAISPSRKYSDPNFEVRTMKKSINNQRRQSEDHSRRMRRVQSSTETGATGTKTSSGFLSRESLEACNTKIRKSYPTNVSSTNIFLNEVGINKAKNENLLNDDLIKERIKPNTQLFIEEEDKPCCSKSLVQEAELDTKTKLSEQQNLESTFSKPSSSKKVEIVSKYPPNTTALHRTIDRLENKDITEAEADDLKGQITKFLEELIDKHPETLDAIEDVRMNRLGKPQNPNSLNVRAYRGHRQSADNATVDVPNPSLGALNLKEGTHVAYDHEDTSQGAVHSFQDTHGNWFTYTFDEQGTGTAQALGSSRAIYEMFKQRLEEPPSEMLSSLASPRTSTDSQQQQQQQQQKVSKSRRSNLSKGRRGRQLKRDENEPSEIYVDITPPTVQEDIIEEIPESVEKRKPNHSPASIEVSTSRTRRTRSQTSSQNSRAARRRRNHSSSSEESDYISHFPTSVFHPTANALHRELGSSQHSGVQTDSIMNRQFISFVNLATRFYTPSSSTGSTIANIGTVGLGSSIGRTRMALEGFADCTRAFADERRRRVLTVGESPSDRREYVRLHMDSELLGLDNHGNAMQTPSLSSINTMRMLNDLPSISHSQNYGITNRQNRAKANYYYRLKLLPKPLSFGDGLKVKLDRLSVAALFDRNNSIFSAFFDIFLAALVTCLASLIIFRGIYADFSLLLLAFVVAGSQFAILKSVQPDAASPVHGYNWLVAYSRPIYFCICGSILLALDYWAEIMAKKDPCPETIWSLNPYKIGMMNVPGIVIALRDLISLLILMLPIAFTIGLLPQVTTLAMHIIEQLDMHLFGSTASFSLAAALLSISKSLITVGILSAIAYFVNYVGPKSKQHVAFSAYVAVTISLAFCLSRWSTNPNFLWTILREFSPWKKFSDGTRCSIFCQVSSNNTNSSASPSNTTPPKVSQKQPSSTGIEAMPKNFSPSSSPIQKPAIDPLPEKLRSTLIIRFHNDTFYFVINTLIIFAIHSTTVFSSLQPYVEYVLFVLCIIFGYLNHYLYPQLRTHTPWKFLQKPVLKPHEFYQFETTVEAKLMMFERVHVWMTIIEKNILYPLLVASLLTTFSWNSLFSVSILSTLGAFRVARTAYAQPQLLYVPLLGTFVLSTFGLSQLEKDTSRLPALIIFYLLAMFWPKVQEFVLKINFILSYIAPWQISWGSAFHAFAQPFSVPHTGLIFTQAALSSLLSAPLNPFLGSSFFLMSYVRPVKFWEKDYNTKRIDHSNLRLISQLDRGPMLDDSNLNSIFYEHLTRSLQQSLAGDLLLGRWASTIYPGDCFILASLYLNCLVHIIEIGNGFVTFQVRGLEFRGTYCHQREVEAISEDWTDGGGLCCCTIGSIPGTLSFNNAWTLRWLAWEVTAAKYIIDGYSITDNSAVNLLQVHELRRLLVSLYVKCMIYYALSSPNFVKWISNEIILKAIEPIQSNPRYVDSDPMFCAANDEDFDLNLLVNYISYLYHAIGEGFDAVFNTRTYDEKAGISRQSFIELQQEWILYCLEKRKALKNANQPFNELLEPEVELDPQLVTCFCFALGILGRRCLGAAAYNRHANAAESFLFGLHALFKGDLSLLGNICRVTSQNDEWVCTDPDILSSVIAPAVRMALKLHQDHFAAADDFEEQSQLYERIQHYQSILFISHEHDPAWRQAIIANTPSLLALRHMYDDGQDDYKIIMLNKMHLNMRVIKLNRECVRAFWAGQQQELIFLRNRNPERGSIQNARQVLRNMINSSADQPIGYPIYVSPLTTSFVETHTQMNQVIGPMVTFCTIWNSASRLFTRLRRHFGTSGSSNLPSNLASTTASANVAHCNPTIGPVVSQAGSTPAPSRKRVSQLIAARAGLAATGTSTNTSQHEKADDAISHVSKITAASITSAANAEEPTTVIKEHRKSESFTRVSLTKQDSTSKEKDDIENLSELGSYAEILDEIQILPRLNEPRKTIGELLVAWPNEEWKSMGGKNNWTFAIENGMIGKIVHEWKPFHQDKLFRSYAGHIYLLCIRQEDSVAYVPVLKEGLKFLGKSHDGEKEIPLIEDLYPDID